MPWASWMTVLPAESGSAWRGVLRKRENMGACGQHRLSTGLNASPGAHNGSLAFRMRRTAAAVPARRAGSSVLCGVAAMTNICGQHLLAQATAAMLKASAPASAMV
eukprot:scaffold73750_cov63-Phaeocystis_antarctica.AAC.4